MSFTPPVPHHGCHHVRASVGCQPPCKPWGPFTSRMEKQERWDPKVNRQRGTSDNKALQPGEALDHAHRWPQLISNTSTRAPTGDTLWVVFLRAVGLWLKTVLLELGCHPRKFPGTEYPHCLPSRPSEWLFLWGISLSESPQVPLLPRWVILYSGYPWGSFPLGMSPWVL